MPTTPRDLRRFPIHLGLGAAALREPEFSGDAEWYSAYEHRHPSDGIEGRLVTVHHFDRPWSTWEMHPNGDEVLVCLSGSIALIEQLHEGPRAIVLRPMDSVVVPPGIWHTADVDTEATVLFITAGLGTETRPR